MEIEETIVLSSGTHHRLVFSLSMMSGYDIKLVEIYLNDQRQTYHMRKLSSVWEVTGGGYVNDEIYSILDEKYEKLTEWDRSMEELLKEENK